MRYYSILTQYLVIFHDIFYYWVIESRVIASSAYKTSQNPPKRIYKHRELVLDTGQPPEIRLIYEKPDSLAPFKSILEIKHDIKTVGVKLAGALKIKQIENTDKLVTVGIDYGKNKIGVVTPKVAETINSDSNFWEKLLSILPKEPFQVVVGLPYQQYNREFTSDKNYLYYLPQILTCIDFASALVTHLYNYYLKDDNIESNGQIFYYSCKCQLCLIRGTPKPKAHPSDLICPESYEIVETSRLLAPPVFLSSESYSSRNSDIFSGNISHVKNTKYMDIHTRSGYLIAHGFEQNPQSSFYAIPSYNSLPYEVELRRMYLKALTRLARKSIT